MVKSVVAQEKEWQRQDDARTLARAQEIMSDKKRLTAAQKEAVKIAKEEEKRIQSIKKVAKKAPKTSKKK